MLKAIEGLPIMSVTYRQAGDFLIDYVGQLEEGYLDLEQSLGMELGENLCLHLEVLGVASPLLLTALLEPRGNGWRVHFPEGKALLRDMASRCAQHQAAHRTCRIIRRHHQRISQRLQVRYYSSAEVIADFTSDLSSGGVFIRTATPLPEGTAVDMTVDLPNGKSLSLQGKVVRAVRGSFEQASGMGIQFLRGENDSRSQLALYLDSVLRARGESSRC